jgi:nucleoside-diphosphate-sugar epimerase
MSVVAITGASGYIGSYLSDTFAEQGWDVRELVRPTSRTRRKSRRSFSPALPGAGSSVSQIPFELAGDLTPGALRGTDVLVHCAYDFRPLGKKSEAVNVVGSRRLFQLAKKDGVEKLIFISSMAAFEGCRSMYGQNKLKIEAEVARHGGLTIRPSTVYGDPPGGLLGSIDKLVATLPIVPVVGGLYHGIYVVRIEDLSDLVVRCARADPPITGVVSAAAPKPLRFARVIDILARRHNRTPRLVPVPGAAVRLPLKILETMGFHTPLRSDSIVSFLNQNPSPDLSLPPQLAMIFRDIET